MPDFTEFVFVGMADDETIGNIEVTDPLLR